MMAHLSGPTWTSPWPDSVRTPGGSSWHLLIRPRGLLFVCYLCAYMHILMINLFQHLTSYFKLTQSPLNIICITSKGIFTVSCCRHILIAACFFPGSDKGASGLPGTSRCTVSSKWWHCASQVPKVSHRFTSQSYSCCHLQAQRGKLLKKMFLK